MKRRAWTAADRAELRRRYPSEPTKELARALRRTERAVYQQAGLMGLRKDAGFVARQAAMHYPRQAKAHQFKAGMVPWNKGKPHPAGRNRANFKPGNRPQTWRPIGSERIDADGLSWVKVSDTGRRARDWKSEHVAVWEWFHARKLPRGQLVIFADRDRNNFAPDNLLAVTRAVNMRRNSYHRYGKTIARLIQLRGVLQRQINKRERHEPQDRRPSGAPVRHAGRAPGQDKSHGHRARQGRSRGGEGDRGEREGRV